ncbi:type 1 periplasmic-binding domain-containing protein [Candidatus Venteria ishoeyi]|nr:hypothetical protein [Candidatus Venteria ishoeyi]
MAPSLTLRAGNHIKITGLLVLMFCSLLLWLNGSLAVAQETVLILRAEGENFERTLQGLRDDLGEELNFIDTVVSRQTTAETIAAHISTNHPEAIVLLGNRALGLYKTYQQARPEQHFPPTLVLSALYIDRFLSKVMNITGIRYEIPAVTSLVQLRSLTGQPTQRIGVLYREWMAALYQNNHKLATEEGFQLIGVQLPNQVTFQQLNYHLRRLLKNDIDALWVVNDNTLLSQRFLQNAWLPALKRFNKPVIVGFDKLSRSEIGFGTYSVSPDHYDLGLQGADMLMDIKAAGWQIKNKLIAEPLSTHKCLNLNLTQQKEIPILLEHLDKLDRVID